ncbi:hypothetical protein [Candidatus Frankia nodulisporulans]|uniref:hypothetical protein n=1 Tax=Candidatus Frankia nodulisporulans TaxID=2060052 RepID=UPI0013D26E03|nr:hypothetical protein [Candidatus Frankia nodulisporulans]
MRLDEHGRWVSDDGAYVWDEAAQTWQSVSTAPPVGPAVAPSWSGTSAPSAPSAHSGAPTAGGSAGAPGAASGTDTSRAGVSGSGPVEATATGALPAYGSATQFGRWSLTGEHALTTEQPQTGGQPRPGDQTRMGEQPRTAGPMAPGGLAAAGGLATTGGLGMPTGPGAPGGLGASGGPAGSGRGTDAAGGPGASAGPGAVGGLGATGTPGTAGASGTTGGLSPTGGLGVAGGPLGDIGSTGPVGWGGNRPAGPWNADSEQTGEIRRVGGAATHTGATPLRAAGVAHWDDELDDDLDDDSHLPPGRDEEEGRSGWAPSRGRADGRVPGGTPPARPGAVGPDAGIGGRLSALTRQARQRPIVLIVATVALVCLGLALVGYLALGGGDSGTGQTAGATTSGHAQYDKDVRNAYLGSCLDVSNGNESYCTCTLDKLEATYTQEEYRRFSASVQSESSQRIVREIYAACRDKR